VIYENREKGALATKLGAEHVITSSPPATGVAMATDQSQTDRKEALLS